ncbi:hypothetical protein SAMN05421677_106165 [Halobacillus aidingensis]|uniref:Uncharacterized protein n=1 Tax=Halobacillus aidingensis TaxID=240303 RepID=A0A1H0L022_HALAD|nr:hypothetical protein SAMN05421677_106165 [Halobacillus aidingensis]
MLTYRTEAREVSLAARRRNRISKRKKVLCETPQSEARGGSRERGSSIKFSTSCANIERPHLVWGPRKTSHSPKPPSTQQKYRN